MILKVLFWASLGALAWTQVGYPLVAALLARLRGRPVRKGDSTPRVTLIVAAHNEETVIERRLQNLLELDYPADRLEIVVASDASTDDTDSLVPLREPDDEWLRPAIAALVAHVKAGGAKRLAVERFDSLPVGETEVISLLIDAGFVIGPRRAVFRP